MPGRAPQAGPARRAGAHHRARPRGRPVERRDRGPPPPQPGHGEDRHLGILTKLDLNSRVQVALLVHDA